MSRREPPRTEEGLYVLHDLRTIDWDAWRAASDDERERAVGEGVEYLERESDVDEGDSAAFSVLGHKADLLFLHLRPAVDELDRVERAFERTALAGFTERATSYVSVTEVSGYMSREFFEGGEVEAGTARYIESRLYPDVPDANYVSFYPMSKRRDPEYNWYDLPFEDRRELMSGHGDIGRDYAGRVTQIITGSVGFDDHEWGVTLFADDLTDVKHLLYEMRFDPSTSRYAEFGRFYVGRRFSPADLGAVLAGEPVPTDATSGKGSEDDLAAKLNALGVDFDVSEDAHGVVVRSGADPDALREEVDGLRGNFEHYDTHVETVVVPAEGGSAVVSLWTTDRAADTARGFLEELPDAETVATGGSGSDDRAEPGDVDDEIRSELAGLDVYAGRPHGEDVYALVVYSEADPEALRGEVEDLRGGFDRYDTHVKTAVYRAEDGDRSAVVSIWETEDAAETAGGYLADLPGIVSRAGEESGFGTMGMFYTVEPERRGEFVDRFAAVGDLLADTEGHRRTDLMVNLADENDMFIASRWRAKEDAVEFFRSDAFRETVQWGREILTDRPRHVFLA